MTVLRSGCLRRAGVIVFLDADGCHDTMGESCRPPWTETCPRRLTLRYRSCNFDIWIKWNDLAAHPYEMLRRHFRWYGCVSPDDSLLADLTADLGAAPSGQWYRKIVRLRPKVEPLATTHLLEIWASLSGKFAS
jgi:hypothetical protein